LKKIFLILILLVLTTSAFCEDEVYTYPNLPKENWVNSLKTKISSYFTYPTETVYPEKAVTNKIKDNYEVSLFKGEVEPAQLVIINEWATRGDVLDNVSIDISTVKYQNKDTKENWITPYLVGYVKFKDSLVPDPLIPLKESFSIPIYKKQAIWLSIKAPENAKPGKYSAVISTKVDGKVIEKKTLNIKVVNKVFEKPYNMGITIMMGYQAPKGITEKLAIDRHLYADDFHHGSAKPDFYMDNSGNIKADFKKFDAEIEKRFAYGQKYFTLGYSIGAGADMFFYGININVIMPNGEIKEISINPEESPEAAKRFKQVFSQYQQHLIEKNWINNANIYLYDEPVTQEAIDLTKKYAYHFKEVAPKIPILIVCGPLAEALDNKFDIACPLINHCRENTIDYAKKNNLKLWMYSCGDLQNVSLTLGFPGIDYREYAWIAYRFNVDYLLYWAIDYGIQNQSMLNKTTYNAMEGNGDGLLFYKYEDSGKTIAIPSIRTENLRDGVEDYMLFQMSSKKYKKLNKEIEKLIPDQFRRTQDSKAVYELRERLINSFK